MLDAIIDDIKQIWLDGRNNAYSLINQSLIRSNWQIGRRITEEEQTGQRAAYGKYLLRDLADRLTTELDKHLDERELRRIRQFYQLFPDLSLIRPEVSWTHYRILLRVASKEARLFYMHEAAEQNWGTRTLERHIHSGTYRRLKDHPVSQPSASPKPQQFIKDPYIFEFLQLDMPTAYSESDLEKAILLNLHSFLLELGKGFAFVGKQYHIKTETKSFFIDLVFYNYLLKCFVLIDLKITALSHQDIGQMDMYVRLFEDLRKIPGDNPTVGIILCADKDETLVKYSVLSESSQLFASSYRLVLPTETELKDTIEKQKEIFLRMQG